MIYIVYCAQCCDMLIKNQQLTGSLNCGRELRPIIIIVLCHCYSVVTCVLSVVFAKLHAATCWGDCSHLLNLSQCAKIDVILSEFWAVMAVGLSKEVPKWKSPFAANASFGRGWFTTKRKSWVTLYTGTNASTVVYSRVQAVLLVLIVAVWCDHKKGECNAEVKNKETNRRKNACELWSYLSPPSVPSLWGWPSKRLMPIIRFLLVSISCVFFLFRRPY